MALTLIDSARAWSAWGCEIIPREAIRSSTVSRCLRAPSRFLKGEKRVGLRIPERAAMTSEGLLQHRESYVAAMRAYNAGEIPRRMRTWTLPFLIRHSAFHTLDHAWEMEDKDLTDAD